MEYVETLVREIAKLCPGLPIWLGGPEVSYDAAAVLEETSGGKRCDEGRRRRNVRTALPVYQRIGMSGKKQSVSF